jgi:hypothetical protein
MIIYIIIIVISVFVVFSVLALCNRKLGKWACHSLGWHLEPTKISNDGCSNGGLCPRCGAFVMQDSHGDWFSTDEH